MKNWKVVKMVSDANGREVRRKTKMQSMNLITMGTTPEMGMRDADEKSRRLVAGEVDQIRAVMSILGSRRSEKKAAAARENGKNGGRPKRKKE